MILFPPDFVKIHYPGYFWNVKESELYSIKVAGVLRKMKLKDMYAIRWKGAIQLRKSPNYRISYKGVGKTLLRSDLIKRYSTDPSKLTQTVDMAEHNV